MVPLARSTHRKGRIFPAIFSARVNAAISSFRSGMFALPSDREASQPARSPLDRKKSRRLFLQSPPSRGRRPNFGRQSYLFLLIRCWRSVFTSSRLLRIQTAELRFDFETFFFLFALTALSSRLLQRIPSQWPRFSSILFLCIPDSLRSRGPWIRV